MKQKTIALSLIGLFLLAGTSFFLINYEKDTEFSCDNLGVIYVKPSELIDYSKMKNSGAILYSPEDIVYSAKTDVFNCPTIDLYLEHLK